MHPLNYSIETATLYEHIYSTWDENSNSKLVLHLLESIKKILLQYGRPTFERVVSADNEKEKAEREQYFQRKLAALKQELKDSQAAGAFPLPSYFEYQDKLYSFYSFCEIFRQQVDEQTFSLLFAFKLREFEEHLPQLDAFLRFHYHINFEEDGQAYLNFLQHLLAFYKEAIGSEEISHHLQQWMENHQDIDEYQRAIQEAKLKKKAFSAKPLHIEEAIIDPLTDILQPFFSPEDQGKFKALLQGEVSSTKIHFTGQASQLNDVFFQLMLAGKAKDSPAQVRDFICTFFTYHNQKHHQEQGFPANTTYKYLIGVKRVNKFHRVDLSSLGINFAQLLLERKQRKKQVEE